MKWNVPNIRYWMASRGMETDADLVRATGWSKATLSRILNYKLRGVDPMRLAQLAAVLKRPEGDLVELEDVPQSPFQRAVVAALKDGASADAQKMVRLALKIPEDVPLDP
ncbi:MAG: helix-turn-helix transcriptional regulator [Bradyrhizobium sp.]|nr:helix-turn-helix transcriptional regulator [Bradyrhizobium sp.]